LYLAPSPSSSLPLSLPLLVAKKCGLRMGRPYFCDIFSVFPENSTEEENNEQKNQIKNAHVKC